MCRLASAVVGAALCATLAAPRLIAQLPIREIPANISDIAIASYDQLGPVIYFNPIIAQRAGPAVTAWIRAHEYGHHFLGHVVRAIMNRDPYHHVIMARAAEIEADSIATAFWMNADPAVMDAVIAFLESPQTGNRGDMTHLPTPVRARLIRQWMGASASPVPPAPRPNGGGTRPRPVTQSATPVAARIVELAAAVQRGPTAARALRGRFQGNGDYLLARPPAGMDCTIDVDHTVYCTRKYSDLEDGPGAYETLLEELRDLLPEWEEEEYDRDDGNEHGVDFKAADLLVRVGWNDRREWVKVMIMPIDP